MKKQQADIFIHAIEKGSSTNGPGHRLVLWVQGCSLNCPGCFNPLTHPSPSDPPMQISTLMAQIIEQKEQIEGITISGGEPLQQMDAVNVLCHSIKNQTDLGIIVFTGYTLQEAHKLFNIKPLISNIDVLIAGRFIQSKLVKSGLRGSSNKSYHFFSGRYNQDQFEAIEDSEIIIKADGEIIITGIDPLKWTKHES